jgi:hypothetical protein
VAATTSYAVDMNSYADCGATDHITSELDTMARKRFTPPMVQVWKLATLVNHLFTLQVASLNYAISSMFLKLPKILCLFIISPWIIMSSLKFTLGSF